MAHGTLALLAALHLGCSGEEGGPGTRGPEMVDQLDTSRPLTLPFSSDGLIAFNPGELNVKADVQLVFSTSVPASAFDTFNQETVEERRDAIYALDYATGVVTELVRASNEGRLEFPLPTMVDQGRLYYLTLPESAETARVRGVDPTSGATTSDTQITGVPGRCFAVGGGDFYFDSFDDVFVARDITERDTVVAPTNLGDAESLCPDSLLSLDGAAIAVEAPTSRDPDVETIRLVAIDPSSGDLEPEPLLSIPASEVTLGTEGERAPLLSAADDGLYVLASDFVAIEIWFVPYARRPGDPAATEPVGAPERLTRIEIPFFGEVVPFEGSTISVDEIYGFAATDRVAAIPIRLEELAGNSRFFWGALVVIDFEARTVDLIGNAPPVEFFEMLSAGDPG